MGYGIPEGDGHPVLAALLLGAEHLHVDVPVEALVLENGQEKVLAIPERHSNGKCVGEKTFIFVSIGINFR